MKIIITDTNVFIDLIQAHALSGFFALPYQVCTTDLVLAEILPAQRQSLNLYINNGALQVLTLDTHEIQAAAELPIQPNLKRITDKTVLLKAIYLSCMVLTGDGDLRKACERHQLEVHGSLWVVREIWQAKLATTNTLLAMLEQLQRNTRLPRQAISALIHEINQG